MKITRKQLASLIRENLILEDYKVLNKSKDSFSIEVDSGNIKKTILGTDLKARYQGSAYQKPKISFVGKYKNDSSFIKGSAVSEKIAVYLIIDGQLYGKNQYVVFIDSNLKESGEIKLTGYQTGEGNPADNKISVIINMTVDENDISKPKAEVKTFTAKTPWAQSSKYEDDVRFFQVFIAFCIDGELGVGLNSLNQPEHIIKMFGSQNSVKKYPNGFDGKWGGVTTRTWERLVDKFGPKLSSKMYSTIGDGIADKASVSQIEMLKTLKDYKKVTKKISVDELIRLIDEYVGIGVITGISGANRKTVVQKSIELGIAVPESLANLA